ncbi:sensor histidine kinase [Flavobacterium aquatile]|uniref:histidine kinase n=1 Tax=Flavobacterium aquatile LMG 4008 = ATCC 11947 TaxID=1453498 RepID=A0A095U1J8_9FLAO|nr:HAMP domain-containing sensor histidine kinase [Flavobacterium aquatile]KGD68473.1 histidine kinase [Flavobacterium aquatile LMG 4008 = ATCC 11947]OXA68598.1 two-component sensor histidine kinase [Flavobacterium aquatile LMG 4008 = ATCC 11947]GEC79479.1 two-component sensor histidine kinase [Flavobacterium aquatile]
MKTKNLNIIIVLGLVATIGILIAQLLWTKEAFNLEEKKFSQKVHIALLEVVKKLYEGTTGELPVDNPVQKVSNDYYIVNVENDFQPDILEFYLKTEFAKFNINTDFEYAMYNCQSDEMVYGKYVDFIDNKSSKTNINFPKHKNLVYYFAIRFPNETSYLLSSLRFWFVLSLALIIILLVYVYSIYTIIQQKKYSELQRDFINNMTHEFKTPLSSILLASNFLNKQEVIRKDEKLEKYTDIIINQSKKLNSHIEQILNMAKSDNSPMKMEKTEVSILPILNDVIENMQLKHPNLSVKIDSDKEYIIQADAFHFTNIVYNLLDNSVKYCDENPIIIIRIAEEKGKIQMDFTDNGIGVSNKNLNFIFDKFYRIPSTKSNEVNGFGLGLYYVKKICTQHNWKIFATNNLTKGITISISIPK